MMTDPSKTDQELGSFPLPVLASILDQRHNLCRSAREIDWPGFEEAIRCSLNKIEAVRPSRCT